jgi:hypothetical protein
MMRKDKGSVWRKQDRHFSFSINSVGFLVSFSIGLFFVFYFSVRIGTDVLLKEMKDEIYFGFCHCRLVDATAVIKVARPCFGRFDNIEG